MLTAKFALSKIRTTINLYPTPVTVSIFTELPSSLLAQMRHMHIHRAGLAVKIEAPGFLQNLFAAEDKSAVFGQGQEQVKFLRAQVEALQKGGGLPVERDQWSDRQHERIWLQCQILSFAASQNRFDTRDQFARIEGLGQVIVCTQFEAQDLIDIFVAGREHQNGGQRFAKRASGDRLQNHPAWEA